MGRVVKSCWLVRIMCVCVCYWGCAGGMVVWLLCPKRHRGIPLAVSLLGILCRSMPAFTQRDMIWLYKEASSAANVHTLGWDFHLCLIWY